MTPTDEPALELPGLVRDRVAEGRAKAARTRAQRAQRTRITDEDPVASVLLDLPLVHLDREFDYAVPAAFAADVQPGVRVKVPFAGQDVDAFVVRRGATTTHTGNLAPLRRLVSPERVLTPQIRDLCDRLAEDYAGSSADVRRLAVPPRHATTEREPSPQAPSGEPPAARPGDADAASAWAAYPTAPAFLAHLRDGHAPRAVWSVAPGEDWPRLLAHAAAQTLAGGRGTLICLPDHRDVARVDAALRDLLGEDRHVTLSAEPGPARRYRDFLSVLRGSRRIVVGTRSAAFAPVQDLGLAIIWDDGDDLHAEPRAPYPQMREVLRMRSEREDAAFLAAGFARSAEAHQMLVDGWAREIALPRRQRRERVLVAIAGATDTARARDPHAAAARFPAEAHQAIRWGLERGPVLVQTPRAGYALRLACERCRTPAHCRACTGPLTLPTASAAPVCRWCARVAAEWSCPECGAAGLRAPVVGGARIADELGRMFPSVPVLASAGDTVRASVPDGPRLVVATPGAEPSAPHGYAVVVLVDTWLPLGVDRLRAGEEAVRRWANAIGLARPGGRALVVGDPAHAALQALVRWDPEGFAARESDERAEAHLPPAARLAVVSGGPGAVDDFLTLADLPETVEVLGPLPAVARDGRGGRGPQGTGVDETAGGEDEHRMVVRVPRAAGAALVAALREAQRVRSARKLDAVRVQVDPPEI